jgi:hypothetical protein
VGYAAPNARGYSSYPKGMAVITWKFVPDEHRTVIKMENEAWKFSDIVPFLLVFLMFSLVIQMFAIMMGWIWLTLIGLTMLVAVAAFMIYYTWTHDSCPVDTTFDEVEKQINADSHIVKTVKK